MPSDINKVTIGQYCHGQKHISVQSRKTRSGMAYVIITFIDDAKAIKAFERCQWPSSSMAMNRCTGLLSNGSEAPEDAQVMGNRQMQSICLVYKCIAFAPCTYMYVCVYIPMSTWPLPLAEHRYYGQLPRCPARGTTHLRPTLAWRF